MKKIGIFICILFMALTVKAELKIDVSGAQSEPTPIALPTFSGNTSQAADIAQNMVQVITADLENSGLFRIIDEDAYIQTMHNADTMPKFADWQAIKAHGLVHGDIKDDGQKLTVSFRLWDVYAMSQMEAKSLTTNTKSWRKMAHIIADAIYERMTGETGYFDSAVVFISETGPQKKRIKRLAVMDQDGENVRFLSDGKDTVLTPRFSPKMNKITYLSYKTGEAKVYIMDIDTGKSELVGAFKGMTFAPRFSPDGKKLVMSMAERGNTDIYVYDLENKIRTRLTNHPSIDTSPSFSPDGKQIAFNSDRSGKRQIYVMNSDGTDVKRISFGDGAYATPVWSPRGDYIAYTQIKSGLFHIGVMKTDGSRERLIANGWLIEAPTWAPNGRVLMFYRKSPSDSWGNNGRSKLYSIDITGHNERLIETPKDASDPAWSPLLH
ncbi:MAG: Tol-Pal system protein TolB [Alphaproteobacteria bacterium]|nr:Tol-Pal system protein TolB [Alphaproteobacteria bacterium]